MAIDIKMPALSPTMEEGTLSKWLVKEGDSVTSGDILAEIETDKATMEVESIDEGTVGKIVIAAGTDGVKVGEVILQLLEEGDSEEDLSDPSASKDDGDKDEDKEKTDKKEKTEDKSSSKNVEREGEEAAPEEKPGKPKLAEIIQKDPDVPSNIKMVETTVRDALRDATIESAGH